MKWAIIVAALICGVVIFRACGRVAQQTTQAAADSVKSMQGGVDRAHQVTDKANRVILEGVILQYKSAKGANPPDLDALVQAGYLDRLPPGDWVYDSSTGKLQ